MEIIKAAATDFDTVKDITQTTISEIYPHYYSHGAVEFFKSHHNDSNIMSDITAGNVFLLIDKGLSVGTITISDNHINRLFVRPQCQRRGYGKYLMDYAEGEVYKQFDSIELDASLPAKNIYIKRGYREIEYNKILTDNGDYLCYDVMIKYKQ